MSKFISDSSHDAKLNNIRAATETHVCQGNPVDRAGVIAASLASFAPTFSAITSGGAGVRRTTTLQTETGVLVNNSGTADTICSIDATELLEKTDADGTNITMGQTITVNSHVINSEDST